LVPLAIAGHHRRARERFHLSEVHELDSPRRSIWSNPIADHWRIALTSTFNSSAALSIVTDPSSPTIVSSVRHGTS
jgi:hypothetical protein